MTALDHPPIAGVVDARLHDPFSDQRRLHVLGDQQHRGEHREGERQLATGDVAPELPFSAVRLLKTSPVERSRRRRSAPEFIPPIPSTNDASRVRPSASSSLEPSREKAQNGMITARRTARFESG